ncbi:MAG: pyridoxal 5'-phosphate synthase glutaminase subunit PdxT [Deltaproteobacteria bacterium]|nr:pyridoxal 5'-phosphate synthase glutaminase subunit PdxT [Deltaproteobacteria bacterium]
MHIGILALQGDFREHAQVLQRLGVQTSEVRLPGDLQGIDGLIIPGGESTTIGKLALSYGFIEPLQAFARARAVWGTCAGMVLLAKKIDRNQPTLGVMDIQVERNAFGRQVDSFQIDLTVPVLAHGDLKPFPAVFIRAPRLVAVKGQAELLATLPDGTGVAAREGKWLATSFHPELTGDSRFHDYFLSLVQS